MAAASAASSTVPLVTLAQTIHLLHTHLTTALCNTVFQRARNRERQPLVPGRPGPVLADRALHRPALADPGAARGRHDVSRPRPDGPDPPEAFSQRAERLRPQFFQALYEAFVTRLVADAPASYAAAVQGLRARFAEVWLLDGSRLDAVAHRLKLTWDVRSPLLAGCLGVLYDLFRGFPRRLSFCADAARSELQHALEHLPHIPPQTLLIADRLFTSVQLVAALTEQEMWLLRRRNRRLSPRHQRWLRREPIAGGTLRERLVLVGSGQGTPPQLMRQIRFTARQVRVDLLTSVLDPLRVTIEEMVECYRWRW